MYINYSNDILPNCERFSSKNIHHKTLLYRIIRNKLTDANLLVLLRYTTLFVRNPLFLFKEFLTSNKKFTQFVWPKKSNVDASSVYTPLHGNTCSTSSLICDNLCKIVPYSRRVFHTLEIQSIPKKSDVKLIAADWTTKITSTSRYDSINKIVHYSQRVFDKLN